MTFLFGDKRISDFCTVNKLTVLTVSKCSRLVVLGFDDGGDKWVNYDMKKLFLPTKQNKKGQKDR